MEIIKSKKSLTIIISYICLTLGPLYAFFGDMYVLENNLSNLDLTRSSLIFIFDSLFLLFVIIVPLGLLLLGIIKRRLKVLEKMVVIMLLITILTLQPILTAQSIHGPVSPRENPLATKVFVVTLDGTRADVFWENAEFIIQHRSEGVWAKRIVCTYPTTTYPNHISLFTGTWPQYHGTESNAGEYRSIQFMLRRYRPPIAEDIFDVAEEYGIKTAIFSVSPTLAGILGSSNTYRVTGYFGQQTIDKVLEFLNENEADIDVHGLLAWIHLIDPDEMLHEFGVDSTQYASAISLMADQIGRLYNKIHELGWENDTVIIVTADHGAVGRRHYGVWPPLVADIPLWMWGRPFRRNLELGGGRIIDIAPTVSFILGIPAPKQSKGVILFRALDGDYVASIRGQLDLDKLAQSNLKRALLDEYLEILLWGIADLTLFWITLWLIITLFKNMKLLAKKERELKTKIKE